MSLGIWLCMDRVKTRVFQTPAQQGLRQKRTTFNYTNWPRNMLFPGTQTQRNWLALRGDSLQSPCPNVNLIINEAGPHLEGGPKRSLVSSAEVFWSSHSCGHPSPSPEALTLGSSERVHFWTSVLPAPSTPSTARGGRRLPGALETWGLLGFCHQPHKGIHWRVVTPEHDSPRP